MPFALFDIETRIDWTLIEQVEGCSRDAFIMRLHEEHQHRAGGDVWIPLSYHVPVSIAVGVIEPVTFELGRLGCIKGGDPETICRGFWGWLESFQAPPRKGTIVSFNGRGFDFPVLELMALKYGIRIPGHWNEKYGNRYRFQDDWHIDVLDHLEAHGAVRGLRGGLSMLCALVGMPAKPAAHSNTDEVWQAGDLARIDRWCRNDVRRLYVVFMRLMYLRDRTPALPALPELEEE